MKRSLLLGLTAVLLVLLGWRVVLWQPGRNRPTDPALPVLARPPAGGDFTLQSWRGSVRLADFRGQVVLLYFGYTWCPDVCPTNLGAIAQALQRLPPPVRARVQVLFVSVDPERDSVQRLKTYTAFFHPQMLGLTGTPPQLARVAQLYGAAYRKVAEPRSAAG